MHETNLRRFKNVSGLFFNIPCYFCYSRLLKDILSYEKNIVTLTDDEQNVEFKVI